MGKKELDPEQLDDEALAGWQRKQRELGELVTQLKEPIDKPTGDEYTDWRTVADKNLKNTPRSEILAFADAMEVEMARHDAEKGDSWKEMDLPSLITLFSKAMAEWYDYKINSEDNINQLIDIANLAMMLRWRAKNDNRQ